MAINRPDIKDRLDEEIAGLDALDALRVEARPKRLTFFWAVLWPKFIAIGVVLGVWQAVVWTGWRPEYALPGPVTAFKELGGVIPTGHFWHAVATTLMRALTGFAIALAIGTVLGAFISRSAILRRAFGSFLTGLQSMPSIAWFPLAILLFKLSESAILFVVVLGAAPSIANGLVGGVDQIPPLLLRAGRVLGARGLAAFRHVVLPAALPGYVAGLKQGWAFAWRSLMAGELIVIIETRPSLGAELNFAREFSDAPRLLAMMIVILVIGIIVDATFGVIESRIRRRRGLIEVSSVDPKRLGPGAPPASEPGFATL
jgi:NitT/TauT family transport system permease protein